VWASKALTERVVIWNPFRRKTLSDAQKSAFADAIAEMLKLQLFAVGDKPIDSKAGGPKPKAIGYVYGCVDAVLRTKGWDVADLNVGVPIIYHVLRQLWPGREQEFLTYLIEHMSDPNVAAGCMHGGEQYLDSLKPENSGKVPMGLGLYIVSEV
jgi:hypothetical protein